jgi:hypothetical protein
MAFLFSLEDVETNFPPFFQRYFVGQSKEIARQCIEPSLKPKAKNQAPFSPSPSLQPVVLFLVGSVKQIPQENCQLCNKSCLPQDPMVNSSPTLFFLLLSVISSSCN